MIFNSSFLILCSETPEFPIERGMEDSSERGKGQKGRPTNEDKNEKDQKKDRPSKDHKKTAKKEAKKNKKGK